MTPLGHAAVSVLVNPRRRLPVWPLIVGGLAPDLDYLMLWAPRFNELHRVVTHNVFFVAIVAAVVALAWPQGSFTRGALFLACMLGGLGHLLVDACMDTNPTNGLGVAWLWPAHDGFFSPINLMSLEPNPEGWANPRAAARGVLRGLVYELPLWLGAAWVWRRWAARSRDAETSP